MISESQQAQLESGVRGNVPAPFGAGERLQSPTYRYPVYNNFYNNFTLFLRNPYDLPRPGRYALLHFI